MVTKRWLGIGFIALGVLGVFAAFINDIFSLTEYQGIGPAQRVVIGLSIIPIVVGLTLLPLGDKPA